MRSEQDSDAEPPCAASARIEEAQRFCSVLGFSFVKHAHGNGPAHYAADAGGLVFEIYPQTEAEGSTRSTRIGFEVRELGATIDRLVAGRGKLVSPAKDSPWGRRAVVADPAGHKIELIESQA